MEAAAPVPQSPPSEARCLTHPDQAVLGACARCGSFFCELDRENVDGTDYCAACAARPDVDYLEAFRLKYWGKRDAWTWFIGLGALFNFFVGGSILLAGEERLMLMGLMTLATGVIGACFWWGLSWARLAMCFMPILNAVVGAATLGPAAVGQGVVPFFIMIAVYKDTRNRLFFKEEVSREALQKAWNLYANNSLARAGFMLSLVGVLVFPLAPVGLVLSAIGLRRVDPTARPPIGRKGQAIAGIVLGGVSLLGWGALFLSSFLIKGH